MNPWVMVIVSVVLLLLGFGIGWLIFRRRDQRAAGALPGQNVGIFVLASLFIVFSTGALIFTFTIKADSSPAAEIQMGLLVVVAIAALMSLLFVLAAGFSRMNLADGKQPLGLPDGSIRAMISLVLIMVFILFGIYLFRTVGAGNSTFVAKMNAPPDPKSFGDKIFSWEKNSDNTYSVWVIEPIHQDGTRLAQQLITTVGTLVVAVAGFYFGSTAVSSAVAATQAAASTATPTPVIASFTPKEGPKSKEISFEIVGTGFKSPKEVRLMRGDETMSATDILSNATRIQGKIKVDKDPNGKWDLVVENEDGKQARLTDAFMITA